MLERRSILKNLLEIARPIDELKCDLASLTWDCDEPQVVLSYADMRNVLQRYVDGRLSDHDIEVWANLVEGRDDIEMQGGRDGEASRIIDELANPVLHGKLSRDRADAILRELPTGG